jgi:protocatechuate 3,4-dioxygenase alpha subunit
MTRAVTPSQTIGPFFHQALLREQSSDLAGDEPRAEVITIEGRVLDGDGAPVSDAMIETWQADATGHYNHPEDRGGGAGGDSGFRGFARVATGPDGAFRLRTIKPGPVPGEGEAPQAPHLNVSVFARGLLKRLVTRVYFPDEPLNQRDAVLNAVPARRSTLIAHPAADRVGERGLRFDIVLQGERETVFFDI